LIIREVYYAFHNMASGKSFNLAQHGLQRERYAIRFKPLFK
jgi:hypothetical protein